ADASFSDLIEIKRNANRAAVLVRQLLAFSRKQTMRPSVLNLTDVVGDLRMLVYRLLSGTNVKLELRKVCFERPEVAAILHVELD
ncbi:hypothetical protein AB9F41_35825, partial [Rhizobium leguminosarum]|uniref:hypothetical protein n=1 Tax=Rhizobium leguminosarum TaxID=384 RepID=UPI003F958A78